MTAPSPFLPGTNIQFAWDSTSLGYLKTCPRLYYYHMIEGWTSRDESIHLRFGIEYHAALEQFERHRTEGHDFDDALALTVHNALLRTREWDPDTTEKPGNYKNPRTLVGLIIDRCDQFRNDPAKTYILANGQPAVELSFRFPLDFGPEGSDQPYLFCGHLDRVVNFNDGLYAKDFKTTTAMPSQHYFAQYSPNNQMTGYTIAGQVVLESPIRGVIIEAAQILLTEPARFVRGFAHRTQDQLEEWLTDLRYHLAQAERYAKANYWPMNDTSCDKFGGCRFREVCAKSPNVREAFLRGRFIKAEPEDRWNPLKPRTEE